MRCDELERNLTDHLVGELPPAERGRVEDHLAECAACREEAESLGEVWGALGLLADEEPSPRLARRFYRELAREALARRAPSEDGAAPGGLDRRLRRLAGSLLPTPRPALAGVLAGALAVLLLAAGAWLGRTAAPAPRATSEVAELRDEVASLSRLVALSLLDQESATSRLRGVSYGRRAAGEDERVLEALIDSVQSDPNVNVRLAAVDALGALAARPPVRSRLLDGLPRQSSPLVQIALVDLLLETDGRRAREELGRLLDDDSLDEAVREHLRRRIA